MNTIMEYRFDNSLDKNGNKKHIHTLDGKKLTGCTTILNVIAKPNLIQWAADMAVEQFGWIKAEEWIEENGKARKVEVPVDERLKYADKGLKELLKLDVGGFLKALDNARVEHCKRKEKAGDWGTETHDLISKEIQNAIDNTKGFMIEKWEEQYDNKAVINFIDWAVKNKIKFLATEKNIYSEKLWLGGIVDFICEIDSEAWIGDIKTSKSGLYAENFWQCGGYEIMLNECSDYKNIKGYVLLNLKENGKFLEKRSVSNKEHKKAFLACLEIYRQKEKTNNQII